MVQQRKLMKQKVNGKNRLNMKKEIIISILAAAALCGCQKAEQSIPGSNPKSFIATIDDNFSGAETKTSLDSQGNVLWKQGDQISIFAGSTINEQWQVTDASDGKTAAGLNKVSGAGFNAGGEIDNNVAFYPYSLDNSIAKSEDNYVIGVVLPSTQNYAEASFGNGAFPMAAVTSSTTDMNLKFKNILGGLKLQLKGTATIASISITGNNDEILCGAANVTASVSGKPSINLTDGSAKTVTLDCGDGVQLDADAATPFVIALPPMTMTGGFTVTVTDTEGKQMEIKSTKSQTIARSSLLKMPAVNYEGEPDSSLEPEYVDLGLPTLWATCNVGASSPEQIGNYFAWGEIEPKNTYSWNNYRWGNGSSFTKYYFADEDGESPDMKSILDPEDDVATVLFGSKWVTPTHNDWVDLYSSCTWVFGNINGVSGYTITSDIPGFTDKHIFLPLSDVYMSSELCEPPMYEFCLYFDGTDPMPSWYCLRSEATLVRPVSHRECSHPNIRHQDGKSPTNFIAGYKESYYCSICEKYFEDSEGKIEIGNYSAYNAWKSSGGAGYLSAIPYENDYVDLGLSVKWAISNVGASSPEQFGNYYAWGETETKSTYNRETYKWDANWPTKYISHSFYYTNDNKTILDPEDDAASVNMGGNWRTPTIDEWEELTNNCERENFILNGIKGVLYTSKISGYTERQIFIPNAGYYSNGSYYNFKSGDYYDDAYYWTANRNPDADDSACGARAITYDGSALTYRSRPDGLPVRAVKP